ncbi:hypothetical protein 162322342 [Organic Lake phycodnavirus 1]|jgi:hypothetical protein|nr:hypothetical protein 162322342 [Organic Lake phycodnavirus 1]
MSQEMFKTFNQVYFDFLTFLKKYSHDDKTFQTFYKKNYLIKQTNIKLFIKGWYDNVTCKYYDLIMGENTKEFLEHDFTQVVTSDNSNTILKYIHIFQTKNMDVSIIEEFMGFIKHLTKISYMYFK